MSVQVPDLDPASGFDPFLEFVNQEMDGLDGELAALLTDGAALGALAVENVGEVQIAVNQFETVDRELTPLTPELVDQFAIDLEAENVNLSAEDELAIQGIAGMLSNASLAERNEQNHHAYIETQRQAAAHHQAHQAEVFFFDLAGSGRKKRSSSTYRRLATPIIGDTELADAA